MTEHLSVNGNTIGQSISGGAATIAAATAPDLIAGIIELAPFTRAQAFDLGGLIRVKGTETKPSEPGQMKTLQSMSTTSPVDVGKHLPNVQCPALITVGSVDPDRADLPPGLGELVVVDGAEHYPHVRVPDEVLAPALPFPNRTLAHA